MPSPAAERLGDSESRPVLFLVDADIEARENTAGALIRHFGADYQILATSSESEAIGFEPNRPRTEIHLSPLEAEDLARTPSRCPIPGHASCR